MKDDRPRDIKQLLGGQCIGVLSQHMQTPKWIYETPLEFKYSVHLMGPEYVVARELDHPDPICHMWYIGQGEAFAQQDSRGVGHQYNI